MAASKKKRVDENEMEMLEKEENDSEFDDDDDMNEEDQDSEDEPMNEEVEVDFEARNPEDCDFHGIRKLLQQLFLKANINVSELADTIISQNYVGSIIKQAELPADMEDDDGDDDDDEYDVFGLVSVINVTERKDLDCVKQLKSMVLDRCNQCAQKHQKQLSDILVDSSKHVGLLLSERFINIPPQIALPSFESLWKEVERAKKKNMKYDFDYYLMFCKTYKMPAVVGKKKKNAPEENMANQTVFINPEEEYFAQESIISFQYSVAQERDGGVSGRWGESEDEMEPFRTVLVIPGDKMPSIMDKMKEFLSV